MNKFKFFAVIFVTDLYFCNVRGEVNASFVDIIKSQFGTKTAYSHRIAIEGALPWRNESIPKSLVPIKVDATFRHGSRFPSPKRAHIWEEVVPKFQKHITAEKNGQFGDKIKHSVKTWTNQFPKRLFNTLTHRGWEEHLRLGQLYHSMMPELWSNSFKSDKLSVLSSSKVRSLASAKAFITAVQCMIKNGTFDHSHPEVSFSEEKVTDATNKLDEENTIKYGQVRVKVDDSLMRFFDTCLKYTVTVDKNKTSEREFEKYFDTEHIRNISERIIRDIDNPKEFYYMYQLCTFEMAVLNDSVWCHLFHPSDFRFLEYAVDIKHYYKTGHGYDINFQQACILLDHILSTLDKESNSVTLRFGHAETLIPLVSLLGFFEESEHLSANSSINQMDRNFKTSKISPFSGNLAIILYRSQDNSSTFISFVLNENILKPFRLNCYFCEFHSESAVYLAMRRRVVGCKSKCDHSPHSKDEL